MPHAKATPPPKTEPVPRRIHRIEIAPATVGLIVLLLVGAALLSKLIPVVLVLIAALMLVGSLNPAVERLEHHRVGRVVAITIVFAALLCVLGMLLVFTMPALIAQVGSLVDQEPQLRARVVGFLASYRITRSLADSLQHIQYAALLKSYGAQAMDFSMSVIEGVAYGAAAFTLAFYVMLDRDRLRGALFALVPRAHHITLSRIVLNLETIVAGYIRGQIITCVLMGAFLFALLSAVGVPNAIAIAAFGAVVDVLPFIGIFLIIVPAVLATLAVGGVAALFVFVMLLSYGEFEARVLIPLVYGRALRLPSSIVLFALITGATLYGVAGALLALPVAATFMMLVDELKVDMPGESAQPAELATQENDKVGEAEYLRRTDGMTAQAAAGIALEISEERKSREAEESQQARKDAPSTE